MKQHTTKLAKKIPFERVAYAREKQKVREFFPMGAHTAHTGLDVQKCTLSMLLFPESWVGGEEGEGLGPAPMGLLMHFCKSLRED